jgi:hypothetical protein
LLACSCQPAVAGGFIYADLRGELSTHLAPHAMFSSCCYKLSPLEAQLGRWHCTHFLRLACLFTAHVGGGSPPLSCGVFLPPPLLQALLFMVAGRLPPLLPSAAQVVYLQFCEGFSSPHFCAQGTPPSLLRVFIVLIAYYSVSLCFPGWGRSFQPAMLI